MEMIIAIFFGGWALFFISPIGAILCYQRFMKTDDPYWAFGCIFFITIFALVSAWLLWLYSQPHSHLNWG